MKGEELGKMEHVEGGSEGDVKGDVKGDEGGVGEIAWDESM